MRSIVSKGGLAAQPLARPDRSSIRFALRTGRLLLNPPPGRAARIGGRDRIRARRSHRYPSAHGRRSAPLPHPTMRREAASIPGWRRPGRTSHAIEMRTARAYCCPRLSQLNGSCRTACDGSVAEARTDRLQHGIEPHPSLGIAHETELYTPAGFQVTQGESQTVAG